jgi:MFS family permease
MTATGVSLGTIRTRVPARLDRLPWSPFHWRIVIGLGTVWILDGLEVTIVGSIAARMTEAGSGIALSPGHIGIAAAIYVTGACLGALFFGQLTDRFGRKKLFMVTLGVYLVATVATAFAFAPWYFFVCRFFTGAGIGGEYAAINSAIDELIPARNRGQVDITINGSYWVGSAIGAVAALLFLNTSIFAIDLGWRLAFAMGGILGLAILIVRRHVPESPRWLFIHGRAEEAEAIVDSIEDEVRREVSRDLPEPGDEMTVRQRRTIPFREIAGVAFRLYPKRAILGLSLFIGQAFLYNAVTFDLGTILSGFFDVASGSVPYFMVIFALGNFAGPLLLGRLFDTVGRKPMIAGTYFLAAAMTAVVAAFLVGGELTRWSFIALIGVTFFFASAGASSAYLTVSEVFPMETRALAIAFFYAVGTAIGGITGPLLFGQLIDTGDADLVAIGFIVGAVVMALGGLSELVFGVRAEQTPLEDIAKPLTVRDAERIEAGEPGEEPAAEPELTGEHRAELESRERAEEERARAAEHRAAVHELTPAAGDGRVADRLRAEQALAEISELRAQAFDERASAHAERAKADPSDDDAERRAALERATAAEERARVNDERAEAITAEHRADAEMHVALAEAAAERSRAREQRAIAEEARARAAEGAGAGADVASAEAELHEQWARMHVERAEAHLARARGEPAEAERRDREADAQQELGLAAEQRLDAARHREAAESLQQEGGAVEHTRAEREAAARREREADERERRIRERLARRDAREREGLRRWRPGPGTSLYSPGMFGTASRWMPASDHDLDREIDAIARALDERGETSRDELAEAVGARYWGPGRFRAALREAVDEGRARRLSRTTFAPPEPQAAPTER